MSVFRIVFPLIAMTAFIGCSSMEDTCPDSGEVPGGPVIVNASEAAACGEIIIKLKNGTETKALTRAGGDAAVSGIGEIDRVLMSVGTVRFERLFPECGRFEARTRQEGMHLWYIAEYDPSVPTSEVAEMLSSCRDIEIIEYSLETTASEYVRTDSGAMDAFLENSDARNVPFPFNESMRTQRMQWHYNNTGSVFANSTVVGADANVYAAWQLCTGNPDVVVAVIDQGVKYDHEDLAANMWVNEDEVAGNGIDDDGNGYIDDIYGYNFTADKGELDFSAELMHGTHVAGTIAAVNNNGIGVCGIAGGSGNGNDGVRIMSCETLGSSESGTSGGGLGGQIRAIKYAADNGAVICQNSWGYTAGTLSRTDWNRGVYSSLAKAIEYFNKYAGLDENGNQEGPMAGGIVVFAAGNDASDELSYPAADPNVISVAATSYLGTPSAYTNYAEWVSLSAPGGDLNLNATYGGVYSTSVSEDGTSYYESIHGTSMACPHVSGACALAVSYYYGADKKKGLTGEKLRQALLSSTNPIDRFCTDKYKGKMGIGSLDTYKLLLTVSGMSDIPPVTVAVGQEYSLDFSEYFISVSSIVYTVSDSSVAGISLKDGIMTIKGLRSGKAAVVATDGKGIRKRIEITVK